MNPGDLVLIPFPFTNLSSRKTRPALIIHHNKEDLILLGVSSKRKHHSIKIHSSDLALGSLPLTSYVRINKVATLHMTLIRHKVAQLKPRSYSKIINLFKAQF